MATKRTGHIDWILLLTVLTLMLFSVAFVYSASSSIAEIKFGSAEKIFLRHLVMVVLGIIAMLIFSQIDYKRFAKVSQPLLITSIILLVIVLFMGSSAKGASRWLSLGFISFQPTELAKFALVFHFAKLLAQKQNKMDSLELGFLPFLFWLGIISLLIALQPNFSNMAIIFLIAYTLMFIGNVRVRYLLSLLVFSSMAAAIFLLSAEYRRHRVLAFLGMGDGNSAIENVSYQLNQSLISIGNGGLFGVGAGQSRQSHLFLPESYGDFIFAIVGEEFGFFGLSIIIILFSIIVYRGLKIARNTNDKFGYYLSVGITLTFGIYAFINAGVNTGLLPTTGVPMPFISYGGSAMVIYAVAMGILLNISSKAGVYTVKNSNNVQIDNNLSQEDKENF